MIVPVMAISNLVLSQQIYSEETNGAHAHNRDRVPLTPLRVISLVQSQPITIAAANSLLQWRFENRVSFFKW